jgi:uncharacterized protein (TIGR02265 family)
VLTGAHAQEVVFKNTVEALFLRGMRSKITERCMERIREAGIDLRYKLQGFYPREMFYRCVAILGEELFPWMGADERMVQLGTTFMEGYEQTLIGKAALQAARFMGVRRTLHRMAENYRTSNNYLQVELKELGPGEVKLTLSQTSGASGYYEGALRRGLEFVGARGLVVRREKDDGRQCTFHVTWTS